jgi:tellurite methyltransferase
MSFPAEEDEESDARKRWNRKYRETPGAFVTPDPFLLRAFSEYIRPLFPSGGSAVDLAGGAGRHAIWLARQSGEKTPWDVTLIDISEAGVELAKQNAGTVASSIRFVVHDLTHFKASQTDFEKQFDIVLAFFYLERNIFPEIVKALRPAGLLIYKTLTSAQAQHAGGPKNPEYLLRPGELPQLATGLRILHYQEEIAARATAELVARKEGTPNE